MEMKEITYREAIREAMCEEMRRDNQVIFMGEDIGVYGGSFGVSQGMEDEFGKERILSTPISESVMVGAAAGAAMTGMRPICEMPFMDFIAFGMDSLVNQAAKARYMFGGNVSVPMVVRLPGGSGTGAAAQHSQSLEAWFCHVPGLKVVVPSTPAQAKGLLKAAIRDNNPVCFIENKLLYPVKGMVPESDHYVIELEKSFVEREGSDLTIVTWGTMLMKAMEAADRLMSAGIHAEIVNPMTLYPMDMETIEGSVKKTGKLLIVHEAPKTGGVGGEIAARIAEGPCFDYLDAPIIRLAGVDAPVPCNKKLEAALVPQTEDIVRAAQRLMGHYAE